MLRLVSVTMKNFMSVGNVTQAVNLDQNKLTLVLGDNIDQGSNGNRNGVGKSVLLHAISYALYGTPITKIAQDNLINKTNGKDMLVTITFEKDGNVYTIERGRKKKHFKYIVNSNVIGESATDEAQGDSRVTQEEINKVIGFSPLMFKHILALNSKTTPFLNEGAKVQRDFIEELLGITQLTTKAEKLKELIKETKTGIDREELRLKLISEANTKALKSVEQIKFKSTAWDNNHIRVIQNLEEKINTLMDIDIETELKSHQQLEEHNRLEKDVRDSTRNFNAEKNVYDSLLLQIQSLQNNYETTQAHKCHACGQEIHDEKHESLLTSIEKDLEALCLAFATQEEKYKSAIERVTQKQEQFEALGDKPKTKYNTITDAYEHKTNLDKSIAELENEVNQTNPFIEQIETITENNVQEIDYDNLQSLITLKEHQEFLFKMLTDKKSWVRMQIIEQNLSHLNNRLEIYLKQLGLPHQVYFLSDLSVEITKLGQTFDFDNLSTGESTRLILALSWAFRDMFETLNFKINLLFIDELIDSGMDTNGGESALSVLKNTTRENTKNIFLISHKEEFIARVTNVLMVTKENGFTNYTYESDIQI